MCGEGNGEQCASLLVGVCVLPAGTSRAWGLLRVRPVGPDVGPEAARGTTGVGVHVRCPPQSTLVVSLPLRLGDEGLSLMSGRQFSWSRFPFYMLTFKQHNLPMKSLVFTEP